MAEKAIPSRELELLEEIRILEERLAEAGARSAAQGRDPPDESSTQAPLEASEARLRQVIDLVPHFIFAKDDAGRFLLLNRAVAEAFGQRVEDVLGRTDADFATDPEEVARFREDDQKVIRRGEPVFIPEETLTDARGNVRYLQTVKIPYTESGTARPAILGVAVDVTERKQAEEARIELETKLFEAQRLECLGILAGGVAHDFNNLLQVILGNVDLALEDLAEGAVARECLEQAVIASRRAGELCKQMLAYAGKGSFAPELTDLKRIVEEIYQLMEVSVPKTAHLVRVLGDVPPVLADPSQLHQVLLNLVTNAADALGAEDGRIEISTGSRTFGAGELASSFQERQAPPGRYVWLEVVDTGVGMDAETVQRACDPFFTTKEKGHGLGLAAVLGIVRACDGVLQIESEPGAGTRVRVLFPAAEGVAVQPGATPSRAGWTARGAVLVVDDDEALRELSRRFLERVGFDVTVAAGGEEALAHLERQMADFVLVVLDLSMPRVSGADVLRRIREERPELPIILTSGFNEPHLLAELPPGAPIEFIQKPFRIEDLFALSRRLLEDRRSA